MILISLVFLFVYLFGAYAYGAATVYSLRRVSRVWRREPTDGASAEHRRARLAEHGAADDQHDLVRPAHADRVPLSDGRQPQDDLLDLGTLIVFLFPPVIMHTVYRESSSDGEPAPPPIFRYLLAAMYVVAPALGIPDGRR